MGIDDGVMGDTHLAQPDQCYANHEYYLDFQEWRRDWCLTITMADLIMS